MAELAALADGTLPADRCARVEARVAASPELQQLVERQRRAVLATQALASDDVPASLREAVEERRAERPKRRVARPILAGAAAAAAAAVAAAVLLSGGPGAPTVADAARFATQAPTGPAPTSAGKPRTRLALSAAGLAFPDFGPLYGWRPVGVVHGRVHGREATVVVYGKEGRRLGYAIVDGAGLLPPSGAPATVIKHVEYEMLRVNGRRAVTWRRGGHTCVLIGKTTNAELLKLASWPLTPPQ
jgi:anti-sigma factor RsiW